MGMQKLSHWLLDAGWFCALGTSERLRLDGKEASYVKRGTANTWDHNNGVYVIYDETRCPWIARTDDAMGADIFSAIGEFKLRRGAYVPHSNDGGHFVIDVMSRL